MAARYILRVDDLCATMNWVNWEQLERLLLRYTVNPILAVVPDNRDSNLTAGDARPDFWERVREWQSRGWTIAIHGYQHLYESRDSGLIGLNEYSEFAGLPIEIQRKKLGAAVDIFKRQGVSAEIWVAPAHSFDGNTIAVLKEMGIRTISDGFYVRAVKRLGCYWIPQQLWRLRPMPFGLWTICIHPNSFSAAEVEALDEALHRLSSRFISYQEVMQNAINIPRCSMLDAAFHSLWRLLIRIKRTA